MTFEYKLRKLGRYKTYILIRRNRQNKGKKQALNLPDVRVNHQIKSEEVRVVSAEGENLGVMKLAEAIRQAEEAGLDLVEVGAGAKPPVAKITSFDKYRYQQKKEALRMRKQSAAKTSELRHMRITPRVAAGDRQRKLAQIVDFLNDGDKVEILLFLKGREKANRDYARGKLEEFMKEVGVPFRILSPIKYTGRGFSAQIGPDKK